jgi:hypothetical protein
VRRVVVYHELFLVNPEEYFGVFRLLEEVEHQVSDPVGVLDLVRHGLVACLKLVQNVGIHLKIILAKDKGARVEVGRYFASGMRFSLWYAWTSANEKIHGRKYHDKGFSFLIPLDMFLKQSSRNYVGYAMAAWLRDQAASAETGKKLYYTLYEERVKLP